MNSLVKKNKFKNTKVHPSSPSNKVIQPPPPSNKVIQPPSSSSNTFMDSITQGFGLGLGSSIGRNVVDKLFNSNNNSNNSNTCNDKNIINSSVNQNKTLTNEDIFKKYEECLEKNESNCDLILQTLKNK